jgi:tetratricopeptide (TPR) repeat protein
MPGQEGTEWCRVQLGLLYEQRGDLTTAALHYNNSLEERNGYAYALAGLARIAVAKKNYEKAISLYHQAYTSVNDYSFKEKLVEIYQLTGEREKANKLAKEIISELTSAHKHHESGEAATHNSDHELALAYLAVGNTTESLQHALLEFNRRPGNIDVNQTLAWVYYKRGEIKKALLHIKSALRTGCKNPTLLSRSDLILKEIH